ncbi:MAG: hypothetical protein SPJ13_00785 [Bacteroidales bacterium]|nr:hypothetical protein [Bacteroidales bacterium]
MALLVGKEYCKVDINGRFKFPNALKKQLEGDEMRFVVRDSDYADCLELWPYGSFMAEAEILQQRLNLYDKRDRRLLRKLSEGNIVELDASDRMMIPPEQKPRLHNAKDIVLQSMGKFIEVWDRDAYQRQDEENTDVATIANERLGSTGNVNGKDCGTNGVS